MGGLPGSVWAELMGVEVMGQSWGPRLRGRVTGAGLRGH